MMAALPHTAFSHSVEYCSSSSSIILDSPAVSRLTLLPRHALDLSCLCQLFLQKQLQKLHGLSLGYFSSSRSPSPHCTMPILCWAVCSAYFIHETMRNVCTFQLHPHSRDPSLLRLGIFFSPPTPLPQKKKKILPSAIPSLSILLHLSSTLRHQLPQHDYPPPEKPSLIWRQTWAHNLKSISASLPPYSCPLLSLCYDLPLSVPYFLAPWSLC